MEQSQLNHQLSLVCPPSCKAQAIARSCAHGIQYSLIKDQLHSCVRKLTVLFLFLFRSLGPNSPLSFSIHLTVSGLPGPSVIFRNNHSQPSHTFAAFSGCRKGNSHHALLLALFVLFGNGCGPQARCPSGHKMRTKRITSRVWSYNPSPRFSIMLEHPGLFRIHSSHHCVFLEAFFLKLFISQLRPVSLQQLEPWRRRGQPRSTHRPERGEGVLSSSPMCLLKASKCRRTLTGAISA